MQRRTRARMDHCVWATRKRVSGANTLGYLGEGSHLLAILNLLMRSCIASSGSCTKVRRLLLQRAGCGEFDYAYARGEGL